MADQALVDYIKQTRAAGFSEAEIQQALRNVGWGVADIEEGFLTEQTQKPKTNATKSPPRSRGLKTATAILAMLIVLPAIGVAGFWGYENFVKPNADVNVSSSSANTGAATEEGRESTNLEAVNRDKKRLTDIEELQTTLDKYLASRQFYPKSLGDLVAARYLTKTFTDPLTGKPYLYTPFGDPALNYSLSFILETKLGTWDAGLQVVSSENQIPGQTLRNQEELITGTIARTVSGELELTNVAVTPFYPQEEVDLAVTAKNLELQSVMITIENLKLTDRNQPFRFRFTAPRSLGEYPIEVFAFDKTGQGYYQKTSLVVK